MPITLMAQILALRTGVEGSLSSSGQPSVTTTSGRFSGAHQLTLPWQPGTRVTAQVEGKLANGNALLRVGSLPFEAKLPLPAQPGERLELQYLGNSPRITFALVGDNSAEPSQPPRPPLVQISPGARALIGLLQGAQPERPPTGNALPVRDPVPLLPAPPHESAPLAAALKQALGLSGLFYESHVASWAAGERPLPALLREPQGRLSSPEPTGRPTAAGGSRTDKPGSPGAALARVDGRGADAEAARAPVHPQTLPHVASQLDALAYHHIVWQGQAWPGQPIEWRIDEPLSRDPGSDGEPGWTTQLRLTLPRLGEVTADLALSAGGMRLRVAAGNDAAPALRNARGSLVAALEQAGIRLMSVTVAERD